MLDLLSTKDSDRPIKMLYEILKELDNVKTHMGSDKLLGLDIIKEIEKQAAEILLLPLGEEKYKRFFRYMGNDIKRNDKNSNYYKMFYDRYKADLEANGLENSLLHKEDYLSIGAHNEYAIRDALKTFDININALAGHNPNDSLLNHYIIETEGVDKLNVDQLKVHIEKEAIRTIRSYSYRTKDERSVEEIKATDEYHSRMIEGIKKFARKRNGLNNSIDVFLVLMSESATAYDKAYRFKEIMKFFPQLDKEKIIEMLTLAKDKNFKNFFSPDLYKNTGVRAEKEEFVTILAGVMNDSIGTPIEDYISDILEEMPGGVIGKIKNSLLEVNALIGEVKGGKNSTLRPNR